MYYLIANPTAGRGRARAALDKVRVFFSERQLPFETHLTSEPTHATKIVEKLPENAIVISLGGDGTVHEIARACIGTNRTVGILPAGSGDDFAFGLGIYRHDLDQALAIIQQGHTVMVDTALVNGAPFINAFGVGFDADVAHAVRSAPRPLRGRSAYLYAIFTILGKLETSQVSIAVDKQEVFKGESLLVSTQNGPRVGGSFLFYPEAKLFDGMLEVIVAGKFNRLETVSLLPKLMKGHHLQHPKVHVFKGKNIKLVWEKPRGGHMEGELFEADSRFDISINPKSLKVVVPKEKAPPKRG